MIMHAQKKWQIWTGEEKNRKFRSSVCLIPYRWMFWGWPRFAHLLYIHIRIVVVQNVQSIYAFESVFSALPLRRPYSDFVKSVCQRYNCMHAFLFQYIIRCSVKSLITVAPSAVKRKSWDFCHSDTENNFVSDHMGSKTWGLADDLPAVADDAIAFRQPNFADDDDAILWNPSKGKTVSCQ